MTDEGFHEIQLTGKQLVFLFMAATVVSVVIFLAGVMVGRGVRPARVEVAAAAASTPVDPTAPVQASTTVSMTTSDRVPLSAQETLTYAERLEAPDPPQETLKDPVVPAAVAPAAAVRTPEAPARETPVRETTPAAPRAEPAPAAAASAAPAAGFIEPTGNGWVVQVMAAVTRAEAENLARRLSAKGYPTFVSMAGGLSRSQFRVRVGKYNERREAEAVQLRLKNEEQFTKTWLTR